MSAVVAAVAAALAVAGAWPARVTELVPRATPRWWRVAVGLLAVAGMALLAPDAVAGAARRWLAPGLLALLAAAGVLWLRGRAARRRLGVARSAEILELCEELAGDLAAGTSPHRALARAAERWPSITPAATAQRLGGSVPGAWRELAARPGASDLHVVAAAWQIAERTGAGLADALAAVAAGLREQQRTRRVVASELASARATARLMAALPLLTLAVGSGVGDPVAFLLGTPVGLACAATGLVLALGGVAWIEGIAAALEQETSWGPSR